MNWTFFKEIKFRKTIFFLPIVDGDLLRSWTSLDAGKYRFIIYRRLCSQGLEKLDFPGRGKTQLGRRGSKGGEYLLKIWAWRGPSGKSLALWQTTCTSIHCKKRLAVFPSPAGMSLTILSLAGKNQIFPGQGEFGKWHPGWGRENRKPFL